MANEAPEVARGGVEFTLGCLRVGVSDEAGEIGREANALEDFLVGSLGKVVVDDLLARLLADFRGEFGEGVRNITAEFIDLASMPGSREDDGRGFCIVRAGGGSEATFAGRADDGAALKRWTKRGGVVLQVRAVAEKDPALRLLQEAKAAVPDNPRLLSIRKAWMPYGNTKRAPTILWSRRGENRNCWRA